jgi:hypothetical protein
MSSQLMVPTADAAFSSDFSVGSAQYPTTVILEAEDGVLDRNPDVICPLYRKLSQGGYQRVPNVELSWRMPEVTIFALGTYQIRKPETVEPIGFAIDGD